MTIDAARADARRGRRGHAAWLCMRDAVAPSGARSPCYNRAVASRSQTEQQQRPPVEIGEVLKELENKVERLKVLYEQYFMGIEKMEPQVARKEVTRTMLGLQQQYIRNTALRFKFNTMLQKWQLYMTYWNRTFARNRERNLYASPAEGEAQGRAQGRELPAEMRFEKIRPPSGQFSIDEETPDESHAPSPHRRNGQKPSAVAARSISRRSGIVSCPRPGPPPRPSRLSRLRLLDAPRRLRRPLPLPARAHRHHRRCLPRAKRPRRSPRPPPAPQRPRRRRSRPPPAAAGGDAAAHPRHGASPSCAPSTSATSTPKKPRAPPRP